MFIVLIYVLYVSFAMTVVTGVSAPYVVDAVLVNVSSKGKPALMIFVDFYSTKKCKTLLQLLTMPKGLTLIS